jgi:hypothetical protein
MKPADVSVIMRVYLKDKSNELAMNSMNKNSRDLYRRINEMKGSYQLRSNPVKDVNGDFLSDSNNILNSWKKSFSCC